MIITDLEKVCLGDGPADIVEKPSSGFDSQCEKIQVFFHLLDPLKFVANFARSSLIKCPDINQNIMASRLKNLLPTLLLADLGEDPWIANGRSADHDATGPRQV